MHVGQPRSRSRQETEPLGLQDPPPYEDRPSAETCQPVRIARQPEGSAQVFCHAHALTKDTNSTNHWARRAGEWGALRFFRRFRTLDAGTLPEIRRQQLAS